MDQALTKVEEIFYAALELENPEARSAFLDRACGTAELRRRVERLLVLDRDENDFLKDPASMPTMTAAVDSHPGVEETGTLIGPYKLMEQIGEGGMGVVYVAEQARPVRRKVALKVIKPGMDTKQVVARFEAERQALALMDHPNIAKVHDAGATESGRPYFVMELVRGIPITEYCDREQLSIPERLELFVLVCRAVQHAHQKGVIHRDLKPSNILVTVIDGAAVPKVIDFGVAKAMGQSLTERTLYTNFHQFVGTPLYMSPEQADLAGVDVDTRSDIYALGVLLYELLTGTTPFDAETFRKAAFDELRRIIREEEPPKPSTRLSTLGEVLTTVSARRQADPRRLGSSLRGELDWVVMRCLEKDRTRRYETASALAHDVMRHLTDQPVEAGPPSAWYRFAKFARRNRLALAVLASAVVVLVLAVVGIAASAILIDRQRAEAVRQRNLARQAVDEMYIEVAEKWLTRQPKLTPLQREFLEKALTFYRQFAQDQGAGPQERFDVGSALKRVGAIRGALGQHEQAEAACLEAITVFEGLSSHLPSDEHLCGLTSALTQLGKEQRALGRYIEAESSFKRAFSIDERITGDGVTKVHTHIHHSSGTLCELGFLYLDIGRLQEAEGAFRKNIELLRALIKSSPDNPDFQGTLADGLDHLASALSRQGRQRESVEESRRAVAIFETLLASDPADADRRNAVAASRMNLGNRLGGSSEAMEYTRKAGEEWGRLASEFPDNPAFRAQLVLCRTNMAIILLEQSRSNEIEEVIRPAIAAADKLVRDFPHEPGYRGLLAKALSVLSTGFGNIGKYAEAKEPTWRAKDILEKLIADYPDRANYRRDLREHAWIMSRVAEYLTTAPEGRGRDPEKALLLARKAVELRPDDYMTLQPLGWALYRTGDWNGSIEILMRSMKGDPNKGDLCQWLFLAMDHWQLGDQAQARAWFDRADERFERFVSGMEQRWQRGQFVYPEPGGLRRVRDEAVALLGIPSPGAATRPLPTVVPSSPPERPR